MAQKSVRQCDWCDRAFEPDESLPDRYYSLINAGRSICFDCADTWEDAEVELHSSKLTCFLDPNQESVRTVTGHKLPIRLVGWSEKTSWRNFKVRIEGQAVDVFGKKWVCKRERGVVCTLVPKERRSWEDSFGRA